jgi:hypothetical protein
MATVGAPVSGAAPDRVPVPAGVPAACAVPAADGAAPAGRDRQTTAQ